MLVVGPLLIQIPSLEATFPPRDLANEDSDFIDVNGLEFTSKPEGRANQYFCCFMDSPPAYTHGKW